MLLPKVHFEKKGQKVKFFFFAFYNYLPYFCFWNKNQLNNKGCLAHFVNKKCQWCMYICIYECFNFPEIRYFISKFVALKSVIFKSHLCPINYKTWRRSWNLVAMTLRIPLPIQLTFSGKTFVTTFWNKINHFTILKQFYLNTF